MADDMTQEEIEVYEKLYYLSGSKIKFNCDGVTYQGIVGKFNLPQHKFYLQNTSLAGTGERMGNLRFKFKEVKSLIVVERMKRVERDPRNDYLSNILKNPSSNKYNAAEIFCNISDDSDDESSVSDDKPTEEFTLDVPLYLKSKLPGEFVLLDSLDSVFHQAVRDIYKEKVIGVAFEGAKVSRFGKISLITIATRTHVYLFDIEILDYSAFRYGLRKIFEDTSLLKVIHDCRYPADCLSYTYQVEIENVFDTQIADYVAARQIYRGKYKYTSVNNLNGCLRHHLDIPVEYTYRRVRGLTDNEREMLFSKRPMSNEFIYDVTRNAVYLLLLHKALHKRLFLPVSENSIAYQNLSKEAGSVVDLLKSDLLVPHRIPSTLLMIGVQSVKFKMPEKKELFSFEVRYVHPKTGKVYVAKGNDDDEVCAGTSKPVKESRKLDKENQCSAPKKFKPPPENVLSITSTELENSSGNYESISFGPSARHMDEVFHKLANNRNSRSFNAYNVNVTPNYVSTFTMRMPFTGYKNQSSKENEEKRMISPETWAKIRAEGEVPRAPVPGKRKISFVPA